MADSSDIAKAIIHAFVQETHKTTWQTNFYSTPIAAVLRTVAKSLQSDPSSSSPLGAFLSCQDQIYAIADELESFTEARVSSMITLKKLPMN